MQKPFMKLFSTTKHGQVLVMMNELELSITWRVDGQMYVNTLPNFKDTDEVQHAFDSCNRETVNAIVSNVTFLDDTEETKGVTVQ